MKHITPIEEKVALDAIKKFRLHNQLGNGGEQEEVDEEVLEAEEEILQREEEIEESLEKEHDVDVIRILDLDLSHYQTSILYE